MTRNLKLAHLADTHLGYRSRYLEDGAGRTNRAKDMETAWESACDAIAKWGPDIIVHAGDVFHQTRPPWGAVSSFIRGCNRLAEAGCPAIVIAGNHDTSTLRAEASVFDAMREALPGIAIVSGYAAERIYANIRVDDRRLNVSIDAVPFGALAKFEPAADPLSPNLRLLVTHGTAPGATSNGRKELGDADVGEGLIFGGYDYVALGHIHQWQSPRKGAWYSGSTERCGWSDYAASPGWLAVELRPEGEPEVRHVPTAHRRMTQWDPVDCEGASPATIIELLLDMAKEEGDEELAVRVRLDGVSRGDFAAIERATAREGRKWLHSLHVVKSDAAGIDEAVERLTMAELPKIGRQGVLDMFQEYLEMRRGAKSAEFMEAFEAKGEDALIKAADRLEQEAFE